MVKRKQQRGGKKDMDEGGHRMKDGDVVSDNQKEKICFLKRETKS
jgi:hypothetical protein